MSTQRPSSSVSSRDQTAQTDGCQSTKSGNKPNGKKKKEKQDKSKAAGVEIELVLPDNPFAIAPRPYTAPPIPPINLEERRQYGIPLILASMMPDKPPPPPAPPQYYRPQHIPYITPQIEDSSPVRFPKGPHGFCQDPNLFDKSNFKRNLPDRALTEEDLSTRFYLSAEPHSDGPVKRLDCPFQRIAHIDILSSYNTLTYINLSHNRLTSVHPIAAHQNCILVDLEFNRIASPSAIPLMPMPKLIGLNLKRNKIMSTVGFPQNGLTFISLNHNLLKGVEGINGATFPHLRQLEIRGNQITSLGRFNLYNLEQLFMAKNLVQSLAPLVNCPKLRTLHARTNHISSLLDFPKNLRELQYVNLRNNNIDRLSHFELVGASPIRALILLNNYVARSEKYRVEILSLIPTLRRIDKQRVDNVETTKATFLREERASYRLPPVRNEAKLFAPPSTPPELKFSANRLGEVKSSTLYVNSNDNLNPNVKLDSDDDEPHDIPFSEATQFTAVVKKTEEETTMAKGKREYMQGTTTPVTTSSAPLLGLTRRSSAVQLRQTESDNLTKQLIKGSSKMFKKQVEDLRNDSMTVAFNDYQSCSEPRCASREISITELLGYEFRVEAEMQREAEEAALLAKRYELKTKLSQTKPYTIDEKKRIIESGKKLSPKTKKVNKTTLPVKESGDYNDQYAPHSIIYTRTATALDQNIGPMADPIPIRAKTADSKDTSKVKKPRKQARRSVTPMPVLPEKCRFLEDPNDVDGLKKLVQFAAARKKLSLPTLPDIYYDYKDHVFVTTSPSSHGFSPEQVVNYKAQSQRKLTTPNQSYPTATQPSRPQTASSQPPSKIFTPSARPATALPQSSQDPMKFIPLRPYTAVPSLQQQTKTQQNGKAMSQYEMEQAKKATVAAPQQQQQKPEPKNPPKARAPLPFIYIDISKDGN